MHGRIRRRVGPSEKTDLDHHVNPAKRVGGAGKKASTLKVSLGMLVRWTKQDQRHLKALAREKRSISYIAKKLKRTELAIEKAASNFGISLDMRD